jgi:hypothetical protein
MAEDKDKNPVPDMPAAPNRTPAEVARAAREAREAHDAEARAATAPAPAVNAPAPAPAPDHPHNDRLAQALEKLGDHLARPAPAPYRNDPALASCGLSESKVPGGMYRVRGKLVNAHGREIDQEGNVLHPEQIQVDPFGNRN